MPRRAVWVLATVLMGGVFVACKRSDPPRAPEPSPAEASDTPSPAAAPPAPEGDEDAALPGPDEPWPTVGIAECDAYLDEYRKCVVDRLDEDRRETLRKALWGVTQSWQAVAAADPGSLRGACIEAARAAHAAARENGWACNFADEPLTRP